MDDILFISRLIDEKKHEEAIEKLLSLAKFSRFPGQIHPLLWNCYVEIGQIEMAVHHGDIHLKELLEKKSIEEGLSFVEKMKSVSGRDFLTDKHLLRLLILKKDGQSIDQNFPILFEHGLLKQEKNFLSIKKVLEKINFPSFKSKSLYAVWIYELFELLKTRKSRDIARKLIKTILEHALFFPKDKIISYYILSYLQMRDELIPASSLSFFSPLKENKWIHDSLRIYLCERIKNDPESISKNEENFDMATDLFNKHDLSGHLSKRAYNDEVFLKEKGRQEINPIKNSSINAVENNLLHDLKKFVSKRPDNISKERHRIIKMAVGKSIDMLDDGTLKKLFFDLIIMLNSMEMHETSLKLIKKGSRNHLVSLNDDEKINLEYWKIITLMDMHDFRKAVIKTDEVLGRLPLLDSEKICFMYLKAESLSYLDFKQALKIYHQIKKISPNYRQVRKRITDLEQNQ